MPPTQMHTKDYVFSFLPSFSFQRFHHFWSSASFSFPISFLWFSPSFLGSASTFFMFLLLPNSHLIYFSCSMASRTVTYTISKSVHVSFLLPWFRLISLSWFGSSSWFCFVKWYYRYDHHLPHHHHHQQQQLLAACSSLSCISIYGIQNAWNQVGNDAKKAATKPA